MISFPDVSTRESTAHDLDRNLFVEAGAGTGKTTALVSRIVNLVTRQPTPVPFSQIVAITFTEKAASELQDRLRQALEAGARCGGEAQPLFEAALRNMGQSTIGTIHSFAQLILTQFPLEAGLPPLFEVVDTARSTMEFEKWWSLTEVALLQDPELERTWRHAIQQEVGPKRIREFARCLHRRWDRCERLELDQADSATDAKNAVLECSTRLAQLRDACLDPADLLYVHLQPLSAWMSQWQAAQCFQDLPAPPFGKAGAKGRAQAWGSARGEVVALVGELLELEQRAKCAASVQEMGLLLDRVKRSVLANASARIASGALEFEDLLILAVRLLKNCPAVARELHEKHRYLLVDEFQDTDALQVEIVARIANLLDVPLAQRLAQAEGGRLFFVGDPRQSIYRFRGADPDLYRTVKAAFVDSVVRLQTNFRSHVTIVNWTNKVFEGIFSQESQARHVPLLSPSEDEARASSPEPEQRIYLLGGPGDIAADRLRALEAREIAHVIRVATHPFEGWAVHREGRDESRTARLRDIAILFPTRTALWELENALQESGIPYRIESRSLMFDLAEVRDLLAVLNAVAYPENPISLVAALRTPAFGVDDAQLLEFKQAGGAWNACFPQCDLLKEPLTTISSWHLNCKRQDVAELIDQIIRSRFLLELAAVRESVAEASRRYDMVRDLAIEFDESERGTLREFLAYVAALRQNEHQLQEVVCPDPDQDAVRLMTIHSAKGLEFPITIVTGLGGGTSPPDPVEVHWTDASRIEFRLSSGVATAGYSSISVRESQRDALESDRLLYVAATRAKDHLVVGGHHRLGKSSIAARLFGALGEPEPIPISVEKCTSSEFQTEETVGTDRVAWIRERFHALTNALPAKSITASQIASELSSAHVADEADPEHEVGSFLHSGAATGTAVHAVLQFADSIHPHLLNNAVEMEARRHNANAILVGRLVRNALSSKAWSSSVGRPRWQELFVSAQVESVLVEGFIDLLYIDERGDQVLVDFKTDSVPDEATLDQKVATYRYQAAAYCLALEQTTGRRPERCELLFLNRPTPLLCEVPDLDGAMRTVREHLRGSTRG